MVEVSVTSDEIKNVRHIKDITIPLFTESEGIVEGYFATGRMSDGISEKFQHYQTLTLAPEMASEYNRIKLGGRIPCQKEAWKWNCKR